MNICSKENPSSRATAAAAEQRRKKCWTIFAILIFILATLGGMISFIVWIALAVTPTHYSVAIDSVSGLDPVTELGLPLLDPAFNLTLRVASVSRQYNECLEPGTYVEVAYRCVTLAASATMLQQLCAAPREAVGQQLVTRGTKVHVPGAMLDSLAADMLQGVPVFEVTIRQSGGDYADAVLVESCGGRRVGTAAALGTSCDAQHLCP